MFLVNYFIFFRNYIYFFQIELILNIKYFLIPFVISQCFRAAGYFNGGFTLITLLMIVAYFNTKNHNEF